MSAALGGLMCGLLFCACFCECFRIANCGQSRKNKTYENFSKDEESGLNQGETESLIKREFDDPNSPEFTPRKMSESTYVRGFQKDNLDIVVNMEGLDYLPVKVEDDITNEKTECSICLEKFFLGEEICLLSCGHYYHIICYEEWSMVLRKNSVDVSCPQCLRVQTKSSVTS